MPIRYYAQRKHIIHSLNTLLYQLHTLSFLLAPSLLVYLCRCATQFQFARARELDGRHARALTFWFLLIALVNVGGVWTHAASGAGAGDDSRTILLDFVGMGHRPSKSQLLLLDATIMFLQALLTTIAYETSLARSMPPDTSDPLFPSPTPKQSAGTESEPFIAAGYASQALSSSSSYSSSTYYAPEPHTDNTSSVIQETVSTSPSTSIMSTATAHDIPSSARNYAHSQTTTIFDAQTYDDASSSSSYGTRDSLPPPVPVVALTLRHLIHRLTTPASVLVSSSASSVAPSTEHGRSGDMTSTTPGVSVTGRDETAGGGVGGFEDERGDSAFSALQLPLPNTTSVRIAQTLHAIAQARGRVRTRVQEEQRRRAQQHQILPPQAQERGLNAPSGTEADGNASMGFGAAVQDQNLLEATGGVVANALEVDERSVRRIPGAIEDDLED